MSRVSVCWRNFEYNVKGLLFFVLSDGWDDLRQLSALCGTAQWASIENYNKWDENMTMTKSNQYTSIIGVLWITRRVVLQETIPVVKSWHAGRQCLKTRGKLKLYADLSIILAPSSVSRNPPWTLYPIRLALLISGPAPEFPNTMVSLSESKKCESSQ